MSQQINLYNPIFLQQKKVFGTLAMLQALAVLLVGLLAIVIYGKQHVASFQARVTASGLQLAQKQTRQATVNIQYLPRQSDQELTLELAQTRAELTSLQSAGIILQRGEFGNTLGYSNYFKALARQSLPGLWLTNVAIDGAGAHIALQGKMLTAALLPGYLNRLTREVVMQGKSFDSMQINQPTSLPASAAGKAAATTLAPVPASYLEFSVQSADGAGALVK